MRILPYLATFAFVAGLGMLGYGYFYAGGDSRASDNRQVETFDRTPSATPADTATPSATNQPTATPTPTPFDGPVARLELARLGINNAIEEIGLIEGTNTLDTPHDAVNKIGWYSIYDKPGFLGNAVFSAHVNYNFKQGPFAKLQDVKQDDEIVVQMEGGPAYKYRVFRKQRYDVDTIPMGDLIWPKDRPANEEWITLITCGGRFVATQPNGLGEYRDRDVVVALRVE
jgi:hypothetical protein